MQRHGGAADFIDKFLTACFDFVQIRRPERCVRCSLKNQIRHFEIAHRPIVRRRQYVDLLRDAQRCFANLVVRANVADNCRVNGTTKNDQCIIAGFGRLAAARKSARDHDVGIGCADKEAEFLERALFSMQLRDCVAQIALSFRRGGW